MKNLIFILSFAFTMFFTNTAFAASADTNLVDEKVETVLTETNEVEDTSDAAVNNCVVVMLFYSDGTVIVITNC